MRKETYVVVPLADNCSHRLGEFGCHCASWVVVCVNHLDGSILGIFVAMREIRQDECDLFTFLINSTNEGLSGGSPPHPSISAHSFAKCRGRKGIWGRDTKESGAAGE